MFKIIQVRQGFATSSSSCHSIIYKSDKSYHNDLTRDKTWTNDSYIKSLYFYLRKKINFDISDEDLINILDLDIYDINNEYSSFRCMVDNEERSADFGKINSLEELYDFKEKYLRNRHIFLVGANNNVGIWLNDMIDDSEEFPPYKDNKIITTENYI